MISPHGDDPLRSGAPSAFDLGRLAGHVETMGIELGEIKKALDDKVGHSEFQRGARAIAALNLMILAALVTMVCQRLHP
jgi:hypothetical protein